MFSPHPDTEREGRAGGEGGRGGRGGVQEEFVDNPEALGLIIVARG